MSLTKKLIANLTAGACAAMLATSVSAAPFVIDLFTDPVGGQTVIDNTNNGTAVTSSTGIGLPNIIGGQRDIAVSMTFDTNPLPTNNVQMSIGGGQLSFATSPQSAGTGLVQLDGADASLALNPTGLGGVDITATGGGGSSFHFTVLESDGAFQFEIRAFTDANTFSVVRLAATQVTPGSPEDSVIPLSAFSACGFSGGAVISVTCGAGGAVDFTNLGALELFLDPTGSNVRIDLAIEGITVPEPGSLALLAAGLLAGGFSLRRGQAA